MSTQPTTQTDGPLSGYLVVDLSRALAGPHAGRASITSSHAATRGNDPRSPPIVRGSDANEAPK